MAANGAGRSRASGSESQAMDQAQAMDLDLLAEKVAARVVERLEGQQPRSAPPLVDASTLAAALGVSRATVYEHAAELGAVRLGEGDRPRLRFDLAEARARWTSRSASRGSEAVAAAPAAGSASRRRRQSGTGGELLPIRGVEAA